MYHLAKFRQRLVANKARRLEEKRCEEEENLNNSVYALFRNMDLKSDGPFDENYYKIKQAFHSEPMRLLEERRWRAHRSIVRRSRNIKQWLTLDDGRAILMYIKEAI